MMALSVCAGVTVHADDERAGLRNDSQRGPPSFLSNGQDGSHHDRHWTWEVSLRGNTVMSH